jgi:hypothetical protein
MPQIATTISTALTRSSRRVVVFMFIVGSSEVRGG